MFSTDRAICNRWLASALAVSVGLLSASPFANAAPANYNLSQTVHSVPAPVSNAQSVAIRIGDHTQLVKVGTLLTPAQVVAVQQILSQGAQSLILGGQGNAVGGTLALTSSQTLSALTIPANVSATANFASGAALAVTGNIVNAGSLLATSSNSAVTEAVVRAMNISNLFGARISADSGLSLTLAAAQTLTNSGTIVANNNVNLIVGGGVIKNSGLVQSTVGNITLETTHPQTNLTIQGSGGTFSASNGAINIRDAGYAGKADVTLAGGDYLSTALNVHAGSGTVYGAVGQVTGLLNVSAGVEHFNSNTPTLLLGNHHISGDPTIFNTGNITLMQALTYAEDISIVAGGNITAPSQITIQAYDGVKGQGHNISLIAGANISPATAASPLASGTITVNGASASGGSISLANSVLDARSGGIGNADGGKVTLVAFGALGSGANGGIENVIIANGGIGTGNNGAVEIIAGGSIAASSNAVSGVSINSVNGSGLGPGRVNISAAAPTGSAVFASNGTMSGNLAPSPTPNNFPVLLNQPITVDGGSLTVTTGGAVSVSAPIATAGQLPGRDGGDISISAKTIMVGAVLIANGSAGAPGATGAAGLVGAVGQGGGKGGRVSLTGDNGITVTANILSNGGAGGAGGNGGKATKAGQAGGSGAVGGAGGDAGSISFTTMSTAITQNPSSVLQALGGKGGNGGNGALGFSGGLLGTKGSDGGNGGGAANGGSGGMISFLAGGGAVSVGGLMDARGGAGGTGGSATNGIAGSTAGGSGGNGGSGGFGGGGGLIGVSTTDGAISLGSMDVSGGSGGLSGTAGNGAIGNNAGHGGSIGAAGKGGDGGLIQIAAQNFATKTGGDITLNGPAHLGGGLGARQSGTAGNGANAGTIAGFGGSVLDSGAGGGGGGLSVKSFGKVTINGAISADGADGGDQSGSGGDGGNGVLGGAGGAITKSGDGGKAGSIDISSSGDLTITSNILSANGGNAGTVSGAGGAGGTGSAKNGGAGGDVLGSGKGGGGGMITLTVKAGAVSNTADMIANGGNGGDIASESGAGGKSTGAAGGAGGKITDAGDGGGAGRISISATKDIQVRNIFANGGAGGAQLGFGADGADGNTAGGAGGRVGNSGSGGGLGSITLKTDKLGTGQITVDNVSLLALGGKAGDYEAAGGEGGDATAGKGGAGGSLGSQGGGGGGGSIFITGALFTETPTGQVFANGGSTNGYAINGLSSGNGGNGGGTGSNKDGGSAGRVGDGGSGGKGGMIQIDMSGLTVIDSGNTGVQLDAVAARGGHVGTYNAHSGSGGNASQEVAGNGNGGFGGAIGKNGSGADGGMISLNSDSGDVMSPHTFGLLAVAGGYLLNNTAQSGNGGNGGGTGNGGAGGAIGDNGATGKGGSIKITTTDGNIQLSPLIATGGDIYGGYSPHSGNGGDGGKALVNGGDGGVGGSIGSNGLTGDGGSIKLTSTGAGNIANSSNVNAIYAAQGGVITPFFTGNVSAPVSGNGGNSTSGTGGNSGSIGNNGSGGNGGSVSINAGSGTIFVPKGGIGVSGGDGGFWQATTGTGGSTLATKGGEDGGKSGNIGAGSGTGDGGNIFLISKTGVISVTGVLIATGGSANGNQSVTGNGGSTNSPFGAGGDSGTIGLGGDGGRGGTVVLKTTGDLNMSELISAAGGNAATQIYAPVTGKGGSGVAKGGNSGDIANAGTAGDGGIVGITVGGTATLDHVFAEGGVSGNNIFLISQYKTAMQGHTGDGGTGAVGGNAGKVGDAAAGGKGGSITVSVGTDLNTSVGFYADGGWGGDQQGVGGAGASGATKGGNGGKVGDSGAGGGGGDITITVTKGTHIELRDLTAYGGAAGNNTGMGGVGGNDTTNAGSAGDGGAVGTTGAGGKGGSGSVSILLANTANVIEDLAENPFSKFDFQGGTGGDQLGHAGDGGNALGVAVKPKVLPPDSTGGTGGSIGGSGNGGNGGMLKFSSPSGNLLLCDVDNSGGAGGSILGATSGRGGNATGKSAGGNGGIIGTLGLGGDGGSLEYAGGTMTVDKKQNAVSPPPNVVINLNGGDSGLLNATSGNGGNGGGDGGDGGLIAGGGGAGTGGTFVVKADSSVNFIGNAQVTLNGGDRLPITIHTGNGGTAGATQGGTGGNGGGYLLSGSAGGGGQLSVTSLGGSFTDIRPAGSSEPGLITANGGTTDTVSITTGNGGGNGQTAHFGGNGGNSAGGPGGGMGGQIKITTSADIVWQTFQAVGGSVRDNVSITTGNGAAGPTLTGPAGNGGAIGIGGSGGDGGRVEISNLALQPAVPTFSPIKINGEINVNGGSVGTVSYKTGNGGNATQLNTNQSNIGGQGGSTGDNGSGGTGGAIAISSDGDITAMTNASDRWTANGGNVAAFTGKTGDGGMGAPASPGGGHSTGAGGGNGGTLGSNGKAGGGGSIDFSGTAANVLVQGDLFANGGSVGDYNGKTGVGAVGGGAGGNGGDMGGGGSAGSGGKISFETLKTVTTQNLTAIGGNAGKSLGVSGDGAFGVQTGGSGGLVGASASGGGGGSVSIGGLDIPQSPYAKSVTVNGTISVYGTAGGEQDGHAGNGAAGTGKGGAGGKVDVSGDGGAGGKVEIKSDQLTKVTGSVITSAGNGGLQNGQAGNGADAQTTVKPADTSTGVGGAGGDIGHSGSGGGVGPNPGSISIKSKSSDINVQGDVLANGGNGGDSTGTAGNGGNGIQVGGAGGSLLGTGAGSGGSNLVTLDAAGMLTVGGNVSANGGSGGSQTGATAGRGGDGRAGTNGVLMGKGGDGGNAVATGAGANAGQITFFFNPLLGPQSKSIGGTVTSKGGKGGAQLPVQLQPNFLNNHGLGKLPLPGNGKDGVVGPAGPNGLDTTPQDNPVALVENLSREFVVDTDQE